MMELFWGFLKVGCFSFGGAYAAIPLIREIVMSYGWLDEEMLAYMIAVSESTPGPIMVNLATYVGTQQAGLPGALLATAAVVLPAFVIILVLTALLKRFIKNRYVQAFLRGMKPAMVGIILVTGCQMTLRNLFTDSVFDPVAAVITVFLAAFYFGGEKIIKRKISPIALICVSAVLGILVWGL